MIINQNTTDDFVSDRPRHCDDQQTDSLVTEFQPRYSDAIGSGERGAKI